MLANKKSKLKQRRRKRDPEGIDIPGFYAAFFGDVADLETVAKAVFNKCREGSNPLYCKESGWNGWPKDAKLEDVLSWIAQMSDQFANFAEHHKSSQRDRRRPFAQPTKPLQCSTAERKLDTVFVSNSSAGKDIK
ncbi:hypothetical protein BKA61DRAFT_579975 [Leptodontidium sp. MPI-SDFR-AT-0119]|nr:hypothetical protein BKA61DRAFT_579975 [Leptodontidium sp. MPI-SDFR-AT-0119]